MENCLVTKLKESVNNDNIDILNVLVGYCYSSGETQFGTEGVSSSIDVSVPDGSNVTCKNFSGQSVTLPVKNLNVNLRFTAPTRTNIYIRNFYQLRMIRDLGNLKIDKIKYMPNLETVASTINYEILNKIDCKDIPSSMKTFQVLNTNAVTGKIEDLTAYNIRNFIVDSQYVSGEIKTLVEMFSDNRTDFSNALYIRQIKDTVKFDGIVYNYYNIQFSDTTVTVQGKKENSEYSNLGTYDKVNEVWS